jgi:hypothetical protein
MRFIRARHVLIAREARGLRNKFFLRACFVSFVVKLLFAPPHLIACHPEDRQWVSLHGGGGR